jgi:hypothetical protein
LRRPRSPHRACPPPPPRRFKEELAEEGLELDLPPPPTVHELTELAMKARAMLPERLTAEELTAAAKRATDSVQLPAALTDLQLPNLDAITSKLPPMPDLSGLGLPKLPPMPTWPDMSSMPDLSKLKDQLPSALTDLKVPELKLPELKLPDSLVASFPALPDLASLKDQLPAMPAMPKLPELPKMPSLPSLPSPPAPPSSSTVAATPPPPAWLQPKETDSKPKPDAALTPQPTPVFEAPPAVGPEPTVAEEAPENVPLEELQALVGDALRRRHVMDASDVPVEEPTAAQPQPLLTSEPELECPAVHEPTPEVILAEGEGRDAVDAAEGAAEAGQLEATAVGEETETETVGEETETETDKARAEAVVLDSAVFDEHGNVKVSLPDALKISLFDSMQAKEGGGGLGYAETLEIVFASMKQQAAVDVAVFEKAVAEQKAKQQAELERMSSELIAAKGLVDEMTFRLEEVTAAAKEAAHDAAVALRETVEQEAEAAATQLETALEAQRLAMRTASSQTLVAERRQTVEAVDALRTEVHPPHMSLTHASKDTNCITPSLQPPATGNTVHAF